MNAFEIVTTVLQLMAEKAKVGTSLEVLANLAQDCIKEEDGIAINKGYTPTWAPSPFPAVICIGVNDSIAHAIPTPYRLRSGDLVSFDVGVSKNGVCADSAFTMGVGEITEEDKQLLMVTQMALIAGMKKIKAGEIIYNVSKNIEDTVLVRDYVTNHNLTGHGIGEKMHQPPSIPNFVPRNKLTTIPSRLTRDQIPGYYQQLREEQMLCIEPIVTKKDSSGIILEDGWTYKTKDGKKSAIFERQVLVTKDGFTPLTFLPN